MHFKTDGSKYRSTSSILDALQLSNHPKMIDKKSELDSKIYCGDALFGNLSTIQSKNCVRLCLT
jgi:hypothetical protein